MRSDGAWARPPISSWRRKAQQGHLGAVDRVLRISESYRRLMGLDLRPPDAEAGAQIVVVSSLPWERGPTWTPPGGAEHSDVVDMEPPPALPPG